MPQPMLPRLSLILGGIASGKSAHAEALCMASGLPRFYLASAQATDPEMRTKINRHIADRGAGWTTVEAPLDMARALGAIPPGHVVLFDCATLWLSNHLMANSDLAAEQTALLAALGACASPVIVVSNEVGLGGVSEHALTRRFANAQGALNQAIAAQADAVTLVTAGLPLVLKAPPPAPLTAMEHDR